MYCKGIMALYLLMVRPSLCQHCNTTVPSLFHHHIGQTGAGKTYTMTGPEEKNTPRNADTQRRHTAQTRNADTQRRHTTQTHNTPNSNTEHACAHVCVQDGVVENAGIIPRSIARLFDGIYDSPEGVEFTCEVSLIDYVSCIMTLCIMYHDIMYHVS